MVPRGRRRRDTSCVNGKRRPAARNALAFWNRAGVSLGVKRPDDDAVSGLLGTGWTGAKGAAGMCNPLTENYKGSDGRWISLVCLQAGKYWAELCDIVGRPELATDERFSTHQALLANGVEAVKLLGEVFAERSVAEWREALQPFSGQWTVVQDTLEVMSDPQTVANGYIQTCTNAAGNSFQLVAPPIQFDEQPAAPRRAPEFNEHGDDILTELGLEYDPILDLKLKLIVA